MLLWRRSICALRRGLLGSGDSSVDGAATGRTPHSFRRPMPRCATVRLHLGDANGDGQFDPRIWWPCSRAGGVRQTGWMRRRTVGRRAIGCDGRFNVDRLVTALANRPAGDSRTATAALNTADLRMFRCQAGGPPTRGTVSRQRGYGYRVVIDPRWLMLQPPCVGAAVVAVGLPRMACSRFWVGSGSASISRPGPLIEDPVLLFPRRHVTGHDVDTSSHFKLPCGRSCRCVVCLDERSPSGSCRYGPTATIHVGATTCYPMARTRSLRCRSGWRSRCWPGPLVRVGDGGRNCSDGLPDGRTGPVVGNAVRARRRDNFGCHRQAGEYRLRPVAADCASRSRWSSAPQSVAADGVLAS